MEEHRVQVRTLPRPQVPVSQQRAVDEFWRRRQEEIEATVDFTERMLPMARLKKVIRAEEDGMMISADTPAFLTKLCELFVQELAVRAWACAESHNRRIILDSDIAEAIASTECYDFLVNVLLRYLAAQGGCKSPTTTPARIITSKRHRPDPDLRRPVHAVQFGERYPPYVPITPTIPAPASVRYMPFPFPYMLQEAAPPSVATGATPTVHGLTPPMNNHVTRGFVFFRNDNNNGNAFACNNYSAAAVVTTPQSARLPIHVPAACYCPFPVANNVEHFAVGNVDPTVIPPMFAAGNIVNSGGNADANGEDVHGGAAVGAGGIGNGASAMDVFLEEILRDEDLLFHDADLFPLVSTPSDLEDFIVDQDVLEGVFANGSNSTSTSTSSN